jgi:DNA-binding transcriptional ArsR family regulator
MRWRPPVLEVDYALNKELHLQGRGLRLVPSFFCQWPPVTLADPDLTPVLVYPIAPDLRTAHVATTSGNTSLEALVGTTRSAVLTALDLGLSGAQIARRLNISPAAASRHLTVLRDAGLITSHRHNTAIEHTLTPLGRAL